MYKDMIAYFSPMLELATKSFGYKGGCLIPFAAVGAIAVERITKFLDLSFLGVSVSFLVLISFMFIVDFITGVMASKQEHKKAIEDKDKDKIEDKRFKSSKITFTFFKFTMLLMWIWLADNIATRIQDIKFVDQAFNIITTVPLILISLREYISIGENIERKYGKKPYIFDLAEKLFSVLEFKFLKKIKDED